LLPFSKLEPQAYYNLWDVLRDKRDAKHDAYCSSSRFSDFKIFEILEQKIPENYHVHISNSSAIRYAELFPFSKNHQIFCNRGTSGIDGCTSTAMGYAMMNENPVILITGELSFCMTLMDFGTNTFLHTPELS
jgi:2-succinyl-5-enolpyruvyl-6-hydroxy-3-cyclohexene-1-carboxylate synthase